MNAIQFIQQHGVEKAREVVSSAPERATVVSAATYQYFYKYQDSPVWGRVHLEKDGSEWSCTRFAPIISPVDLSDLKRLVKSVDTVNSFGGLEDSKAVVKMGKYYKYLKKAIADYESIGGEHV